MYYTKTNSPSVYNFPFTSAQDAAKSLRNQHLARPLELLNDDRHRVTLLTIPKSETLAEQSHLYARKRITVLEGCAVIFHGEAEHLIHEGKTHVIPAGTLHRIANAGLIELKLLELRSGACVEDDDLAT